MRDIPMYSNFFHIKAITEGMSGDSKSCIETKDGRRLLLRLADIAEYERKKTEYDSMQRLYGAGVSMPKPVDFGICCEGKKVYTLIEWAEGTQAEKLIPKLDPRERYKLGVSAGKVLRSIHAVDFSDCIGGEWQQRYFDVIDCRLEAFMREGKHFDGDKNILSFLKNNRQLLSGRLQCRLHGDFHTGNMIVTKNREINVIDWHTVDFDNYGDPLYDFSRLASEYPDFASGQLDGYTDGKPTEDFFTLLAYYLCTASITSIVWAKYFSPESLDDIIGRCISLNRSYNGMTDVVPDWYNTDFL